MTGECFVASAGIYSLVTKVHVTIISTFGYIPNQGSMGKLPFSWCKLVEAVYSSEVSIISGDTLLTDTNIDQIISSGVQIKSPSELKWYTWWPLGFNATGEITHAGCLLLNQLIQIYFKHDFLDATSDLPLDTPTSESPVAESSQSSCGPR